jgi:hypothetical protein
LHSLAMFCVWRGNQPTAPDNRAQRGPAVPSKDTDDAQREE